MLFFKKSPQVVIRPRAEHPLSRKQISPEALKVLYRLNEDGFKAYLVGGSVRDLLLGRQPKDFDISTDAHPREIKRLFRNCFLVGRRFRLAHVVFGDKVIETSTFRRQPDETVQMADENAPGALYQSSDNTFGTPEEDAKRRDFTVNGLFYDIKTFEIIDYVGGLRDLDRRVLRAIGDPNVRFREDPVRMMRAVRLAARLEMTIERKTYRAIRSHHREIQQASSARVLEEIFRLFAFHASAKTFRLLWDSGLMASLMPALDHYVRQSGKEQSPLWDSLERMDAMERQAGAEFSNGLRLAVLAYPLFAAALAAAGGREAAGVHHLELAEHCLADFNARFKLPKTIYYHVLHLLDDQQRLAVKPAPGRRIRPGRAQQFADALLLARIVAGSSAETTAILDAWQALMPASPQAGRPPPGVDRRRQTARPDRATPDRAAADQPDGVPAESGEDADAKTPSAGAGGAEGQTPRRRKRRGGRRHHRRTDERRADVETPAATPRTPHVSLPG